MKVLHANVKGPITINVVESVEDLPGFYRFVEENPFMGFDTETTGLDWWNAGDGFHCRLAQFGNHDTAWVIPVELGEPFVQPVTWALETAKRLAAQNRGFDIHVVEECFGVDPLMLVKKTWDTVILAHLVDSRAVKEGGPGLRLEELVPFYIDKDTGAEVKKSMTSIAQDMNRQKKVVGYKARNKDGETLEFRITERPDLSKEVLKAEGYSYIREFKEEIYGRVNKENVWNKVPLFHEGYLLYAGMDPIFAYRLRNILFPLIPRKSLHYGLVGWEHRLNWVTYQMERTGYLVDEKYTRDRIEELKEEEARCLETIQGFGIENPGSNDQLIEVFQGLGIELKDRTKPTERHPKGQYKMDEGVLSSIEHPLAQAVMDYKGASKKRTNWFEKALNSRDKNGRVHATLNSLRARTARMSITGAIPAQTLPAGTGYVRHSFLAEPGHVTVCIDFGNQELRVAAYLSKDRRMLEAFEKGEDLHQLTADSAGVPRKIGKMCNFLVAYGGGPKALAEQANIPLEQAREVVAGFNRTYPGVAEYGKQMAEFSKKHGYIYTLTGRQLKTDPGRDYASINFAIQSAARDTTAKAAIDLDREGFTPYMRLLVHDEAIFSFPKNRARELTNKASKIMEFNRGGLFIPADGEIGGQSWGSVLDKEGSKH